MVVDVGRPGTVEWNESASIDRATEDIFWDEVSFVPSNNLASKSVSSMLALPDILEPFPVRVVTVFEPLVDEDVSGIVVERFANKLAHLKRWLREGRIMAHAHLVLRESAEMYARGKEEISNEDMCEIRDLVFATNVPALNRVLATRNDDQTTNALFLPHCYVRVTRQCRAQGNKPPAGSESLRWVVTARRPRPEANIRGTIT